MTLQNLLRRVRDGHASGDELAACRALVATDLRVPDDLRDDLLGEDPAGDAAGLLAMLFDEADLGLAAAVGQELGEEMAFDPAELDLAWGIPLGEAVRAEAGTIEIAADVARAAGIPAPVSYAESFAAEAGAVELWPRVAAEIGCPTLSVAEAVRDEAGTVSLWPAVRDQVSPAPLRASGKAANNNRWWMSGLVAAAAAALLFVGWPAHAPVDGAAIVLAGSAETRVEALVSSDRVTVMQLEGDEGALILWIEDNVAGEVL